jgi:hypothetical protein
MKSAAQMEHLHLLAGRPAVLWPYVQVAFPDPKSFTSVQLAAGKWATLERKGSQQSFKLSSVTDVTTATSNPQGTFVISFAETYNDDHFELCRSFAERFHDSDVFVLLVLPDHVEWRDDPCPRPEDLDPAWRQIAANCSLIYRDCDYEPSADNSFVHRRLRRYHL